MTKPQGMRNPPAVEPAGAQGLVCSSLRRQAYTLGPDAAGGANV